MLFARAGTLLSRAAASLPLCKRLASRPASGQTSQRRLVHVRKRLEDLGIELPPPAGPRANYDVVCADAADQGLLYVSGHLPFTNDGTLMTGRITSDGERGVDYGYKAARAAALNIVSTLSDRLDGDLDRVEKIQKVFGIVQSTDDFKEQHLVMDGASDLFLEVFGTTVGYHARSAIGTSTLPLDIAVEIECIVRIKLPEGEPDQTSGTLSTLGTASASPLEGGDSELRR